MYGMPFQRFVFANKNGKQLEKIYLGILVSLRTTRKFRVSFVGIYCCTEGGASLSLRWWMMNVRS
jgi:hypothetical protein